MCSSRLGVTTAHSGAGSAGARHQPRPCARWILSISRVPPIRAAMATMVLPSAVEIGRGLPARRWQCTPPALRARRRAPGASALPASRSRRSPFAKAAVGREQRAAEGQGLATFVRTQVGIPAAQRESVGLSNRRHGDKLDGPVEIPHHSPDQRQLLDVFLPEAGQVRLHQMKQLGHHGENTGKMTWPGCALPPFRRFTRSAPAPRSRTDTSPRLRAQRGHPPRGSARGCGLEASLWGNGPDLLGDRIAADSRRC